MKQIGFLAWFLVAAIAVWFLVVWDRASLHYKLTYEVDVRGEVRTGSGVVEIRTEDTSRLPILGRGFGAFATGEAVVIDLGDGRYLFSLLDKAAALPFGPFIDYFRGDNTGVDVVRALKSEKPSAELAADQLPLLVAFSDLDDPKSVRKVDPKNLAAIFGPGVRLRNVTLEITEEPVTRGAVESVLEWMTWPQVKWNSLSTDGFLPMRVKLRDGKTKFVSRSLFRSAK